GDRLDFREGDVPAPEPVASQPIAGEGREVDARAEGPAAATDDDRACLLVAPGEGRGAVEVVDRVVVGGIELLGAGELEAADAVPAGGVPGVRGALRAALHLRRSSRTRIALPSLRGSVCGATISATTARPSALRSTSRARPSSAARSAGSAPWPAADSIRTRSSSCRSARVVSTI